MLREQHRFFLSVLVVADFVLIVLCGVAAYGLRFHALAGRIPPLPSPDPISYQTNAIPMAIAAPVMVVAMYWVGLYRPRRDERFHLEAAAIIKGTVIGVVLTASARGKTFSATRLSIEFCQAS